MSIGFLDIRFVDIIDILLVAFILFQLYFLVRGSIAYSIFIGFIIIYLLSLLARAFDMQLMSGILGAFINIGVVAVLIVFQPEVRRFLLYLGKTGNTRMWKPAQLRKLRIAERTEKYASELTNAVMQLSETKTGGLIVIPHTSGLQVYADTGTELNAVITSQLVTSIFNKTSPLHDGAIIISDQRIAAAKCILPVSENPDLPASYGLRHRSAVGISEVSDATAIVVSEQNGQISIAKEGKMTENISRNEIKEMITRALFNSR